MKKKNCNNRFKKKICKKKKKGKNGSGEGKKTRGQSLAPSSAATTTVAARKKKKRKEKKRKIFVNRGRKKRPEVCFGVCLAPFGRLRFSPFRFVVVVVVVVAVVCVCVCFLISCWPSILCCFGGGWVGGWIGFGFWARQNSEGGEPFSRSFHAQRSVTWWRWRWWW